MIDDFMDDCVWMSYRYCIGRHTIAAILKKLNLKTLKSATKEGPVWPSFFFC